MYLERQHHQHQRGDHRDALNPFLRAMLGDEVEHIAPIDVRRDELDVRVRLVEVRTVKGALCGIMRPPQHRNTALLSLPDLEHEHTPEGHANDEQNAHNLGVGESDHLDRARDGDDGEGDRPTDGIAGPGSSFVRMGRSET